MIWYYYVVGIGLVCSVLWYVHLNSCGSGGLPVVDYIRGCFPAPIAALWYAGLR